MILKHMKENGRIKQLLGALVLVLYCCSYSNTSLAYTQQYNVGDTGPNGGQVTAVDVTATVTGTEVALNGGFEETTTTTLYTETVTEQISTTETVTNTTTTTVETTTANQLNDINLANGDWQAAGSYGTSNRGSGCSYSGSLEADEFCTGAMTNTNNSNVANTDNWNVANLGGGYTRTGPNGGYVELTQNLTEAEIQAGFDINYGVTVESHTSNKTVPLCSATTGDCKDLFSVTLTLKAHKPGSGNYDYLYPGGQYETLTYSGTQTYTYTYSLDSNSYTRVDGLMELWGVDAGYHNGMYGPIFSDPFIKLTYDAVTLITEQITNIVLSTQETVYNTSEDVMTSVYIGDPTTETTAPVVDYSEVDSFEIEIVDADGGGIELEFTVEVDETSNTATVEMSSTNLDTGVVQVETISEISLDFDMDTGGTDVPEITVAEIEADIGAQIDSAVASVDIEVNTTEGGMSENASTEPEVSEAEVGADTSSTEQTESIQESNSNAEQSVGEGDGEQQSETSGDTGSEGDSSGSEGESETDNSGASESSSEKDGDSAGGDESRGEEKDAGRSEGKSKDSKDKTKSKSDEGKAEKVKLEIAKAKQKIADRILSAMADTYSAINEATKIALISSLADTENFKKYVQKQNEDAMEWYSDTQVYRDQQMLGDPYGALFGSAQDNLMNEMINEQYKPGYGLGLQ